MQSVRYSRHAKQRMKLYRIPESVITDMVTENDFENGHHEIVKEVQSVVLPIKVIFDVYDAFITVVTAYPLKRKKI